MKKYIVPTLVLALGITALGIHSASAASTAPTAPQIIAKSDTEITARIASLNKLSARLAKFKHLSDTQRASLNANIQSSIDAMNALKTKIDGETDVATLKTDYASITKDYRIYMVVVPSNATIAAVDNDMGSITTLQATLAKLQPKLKTTAENDSYADATAKLTDAQTQSQNLINAVSSLKPDMGDKTVEATNKTQIAAAKTARKAIATDLAAARKDIKVIRTDLK